MKANQQSQASRHLELLHLCRQSGLQEPRPQRTSSSSSSLFPLLPSSGPVPLSLGQSLVLWSQGSTPLGTPGTVGCPWAILGSGSIRLPGATFRVGCLSSDLETQPSCLDQTKSLVSCRYSMLIHPNAMKATLAYTVETLALRREKILKRESGPESLRHVHLAFNPLIKRTQTVMYHFNVKKIR